MYEQSTQCLLIQEFLAIFQHVIILEDNLYLNNQSVVYGISAYESNSMKSANPHSGIYEADTTRTLDNNGGNPACNQGGMIVLEGNGSRPSHQGEGYKESEVSYTLNAVEQHGVCYRKQGHPQNAEQGQGWERTDVNDTLNAFDSGEMRTPTIVLENHPADSRIRICEDEVFQTLSSRMETGGGNTPMILEGEINAKTRDQVLCLLQETYGEKKVVEWGIAIMASLQQAEILQSGMYESSVQGEAQKWEELDDSTLPRPTVVAEWVLRNMRQQQECGRASQGWESTAAVRILPSPCTLPNRWEMMCWHL